MVRDRALSKTIQQMSAVFAYLKMFVNQLKMTIENGSNTNLQNKIANYFRPDKIVNKECVLKCFRKASRAFETNVLEKQFMDFTL